MASPKILALQSSNAKFASLNLKDYSRIHNHRPGIPAS